MNYLKHALQDTWKGQGKALFVLIVGGLIGLAYLWWDQGREEAVAEVPYWEAAVFGSLGSLVLLFCWNLVCAPYRIEKEARLRAEGEAEKLRAMVPSAPAPRTLSDDQKASLADALSNCGIKPKSISVLYDGASEECVDFAVDIGDAIEMAGIATSVHDGIMLGRSAKDRGIKLYVGKSKTMQSLATVVFEQFTKFGFSPERRKTQTPDNLFIDVCRLGKR